MNNDALLEKQRKIIRTIKLSNYQLKEAILARRQIDPILHKLRLYIKSEPKQLLSDEGSSFTEMDLHDQVGEVASFLANIQQTDNAIKKIRLKRNSRITVTVISLFALFVFLSCSCLICTSIYSNL